MNQEEIVQSKNKNHVKIYKLKQLGIKNKDIAKLLDVHPGYVYWASKNYKDNPEKIEAANLIQ